MANRAKRAREEGIDVVCSDGTVYVLDAAAAARSAFFAAGAASGMRDARASGGAR